MKNPSLKIVSLNIEKDKHFDRIIPFLKEQRPDALLLQEIFSKDIPLFEERLGMKSQFVPIKIILREGAVYPFGLATFSSLPMANYSFYYRGTEENPPVGPEGEPLNTARAALVSEVSKNNQTFRLINTHFTWTPDGQPSDLQYEDLPKLLRLLAQFPDFILCGDLNAPRGRPIFDKIASLYKDNIPLPITTTIDKNLHRAGDLQLVVDCLFSTATYKVENVQVFENLSDHCAISGNVSLNS
jgi:endonuclease/exonuclease/phosphatase (EEP) superfamily protein YafD